MAFTPPIHLIGFTVSGDFGPLTIYTDRFGKKVAYPKSPPNKPPSFLQSFYRDRFRSAQRSYMEQTPQIKESWERIVQHTNLCMTGQNLWIHVSMMHTTAMLTTLIQQTGISVNAPPLV